ncbi:ABC transporter substrate-binding protein [Streptomyces sp. NPDC059215]|uniref:ABC transporter substrate-binding protein n=1 Tax=Streptomyces sp. NPDC059215 TaxID=3346772 RepID=UPI0036BEC71E
MKIRTSWQVKPVLTGMLCVLLAGCGSTTDGLGGDSAEITVGTTDEVLSTDPASGYDPGSWMLFNNVFQSLLSFPDGSTEPEPDAAESCSFIDTNTRIYRCRLRDGLKFSNDDALTAEDVKFSFDRMLKIHDAAGPSPLFENLDRVETPDDKTVIFRLGSPDATFPSKIASGAGSIVDHNEYEPGKLEKNGHVVGSGPYTLDSFDPKGAYLSANTKYKGLDRLSNSHVALKFFHGNQGALKSQILSGDVDIAYRGLSASDIAEVSKPGENNHVDVVEGDSTEVQHLVFNMKDPVAGNIGVRQAMAYLIDRFALVKDIYHDTVTPLYSIIPAGILGHTSTFDNTYGSEPSVAKAKSALRAAGFQNTVKLTLWSTPSRYGPATDAEMEMIAKQLNDSGLFDAEVKSVAFERYAKDISAGKYGVYVKGWLPDYPDAENFTAPFFGRGNVLENNYASETITHRLIPHAAAEVNRSATVEDYEKLQNIVAEQLPILPIWQAKGYLVVRDGIHGYEYCLDPSTIFRFWELNKI